MKVSVITISFRDLEGLQRTRASVAAQKCDSVIEHIVVDGGSGNDTVRYLESLGQDLRWVSEPDCGRYDAMNKGIRMADGDLLWFLHAGDVFGSEYAVSTTVAGIRRSTEDMGGAWGYGLARKVNTDGRPVGIFGNVPFSLRRFALGGHPIPHQAAFFGARLADEIGGYDLTHGLAADQLFMLECAVRRAPVVVVDFLCDFDVSGAGSTRSAREHFRDMRLARRKVGLRPTRSRALDALLSVAAEVRFSLARALSRRWRDRMSTPVS